jgi:hypothetical protein
MSICARLLGAGLGVNNEGAMSRFFVIVCALMQTIAPGAVLICSLFLSSLLSIAGAQANPLAYATTGDDQFGVVDLMTGVFTERGNMGVRLTGLGEIGGKLYGGGYVSNTLYSVNPSTGKLTTIGSGSLTPYYWATGSTKTGLFALDRSANMNLYSINPKTGGSTLIGPTGLSPTAIVEGMSTGSDTLYVTVDSSLYSINTTTGASTLIGTSPQGLFGPMVVEGPHNVIYSGAFNPDAIWILNGTNGFGSFIADTTGADTNFWGLAPLSK